MPLTILENTSLEHPARESKLSRAIKSIHLEAHESKIDLGAPHPFGLCCLCAAMTENGYRSSGIAATVKTTINGRKWRDRYLCKTHFSQAKNFQDNLPQRSQKRKEIEASLTRKEAVLSLLGQKVGALYSKDLIETELERSGYSFSRDGLNATLKDLKNNEGVVMRRIYGATAYRLPLNLKVGTFVVEMQGKRSQRTGWVEDFTEKVYPIVRWKDLSRSISSDDLLDYLDNFLQRQEIKVIHDLYTGQFPVDFKPIPYWMFEGLVYWRKSGDIKSINCLQLLEIAKHLGYAAPSACGIRSGGEAYRKTVNYLSKWYPQWKHEKMSIAAMSIIENVKRSA